MRNPGKWPLWGGYEALSLEGAKQYIRQYKVVVATSSLAYDSIKESLEMLGLVEYRDFCRLEFFMLEWYWKNKNQLCISQINSAVTTRCTFRCKHCSNLMPYFTTHYEYNANDVRNDLELFFSKVDYVNAFYILGGEPLLCNDISNIVDMVCSLFGDRIGCVQIVTNGSIVPNKELTEVLKKYNVNVRVSDYTRKIPYERKYLEVINHLRENQIDYSISDYKSWMDLGFPCEIDEKYLDINQHMRNCSQGCHMLNDGRFFYCGVLWNADKCGLYKLNDADYIDLQDENVSKLDVLKYCLGIQNGYISLCEKCYGFGPDNTHIVEVAEQI